MIELKRKIVHFTGLTVPALQVGFGRDFTISFLVIVLIVFTLFESVRLDKKLRDDLKKGLKLYLRFEDIERVIDEMTRFHERSRIGAHIYFVLGSLAVLWFFPDYSVGIITVAVVSDALASILGRFGRVRVGRKTIEGFLSYLISGFAILTFFNFSHPFLIALVGATVELLNVPPDDNFSCQVSMGIFAYLLSIAF
ncbi:MAG: phosphatidate cytidylyltransferase [Archaeoglobales archaeon]|nr:MAG: phosphatidate cytidylyltransferase [Archaeoglobales archaeon]